MLNYAHFSTLTLFCAFIMYLDSMYTELISVEADSCPNFINCVCFGVILLPCVCTSSNITTRHRPLWPVYVTTVFTKSSCSPFPLMSLSVRQGVF